MLAQGSAPDAASARRPVLAIDFGERRIGLAISDPDRRLALPLGVVERQSDREAIARLRAVSADGRLLIVGEPALPRERAPGRRRAAFRERSPRLPAAAFRERRSPRRGARAREADASFRARPKCDRPGGQILREASRGLVARDEESLREPLIVLMTCSWTRVGGTPSGAAGSPHDPY